MAFQVGFIGFGGMICGHHLGTIRRDDVPFEAVAAFDIDPDRRAAAVERGLVAYDNLEGFLAAGGYDLVVVGTANNYHCEMACRAMEAGDNVMVEKPAARNTAELEKMIDDGVIGKPYMIESRIHSVNGNGDMYGWRAMNDHGG